MKIINKPKIIFWTKHVEGKMRFYHLSKQRVLRVLNSPKRVEEGVAPKTMAMMQPSSTKTKNGKTTWGQEIWAMIQETKDKKKIVSAWRYPGMTKPRSEAAKDLIRQEYDDFIINGI